MSASPAGGPNGQNPTPPGARGPNGPRMMRRRDDNPLVQRRKKPMPRPQSQTALTTAVPLAKPSAPGPSAKASSSKAQPSLSANGALARPKFDDLHKFDGWSFDKKPLEDNPECQYREFPLVTTKKQLREGLHFHVMRLVAPHHRPGTADQGIDPTNQEEFTRPVTLQRRDPRQPPPGREVKEEPPEKTAEQIAETERLAHAKAERDAQRALDDQKKAPIFKDEAKKQPKKQDKRPSTQPSRQPRTEEAKKQQEIRYSETLPWHLEDADSKNVWVGQYEAPLSSNKVAFMIDHQNGNFRMIPLERYYRFTSKRAGISTMTIEEAEKQMAKKVPVTRWAQHEQLRARMDKEMADSRQLVNGRTAVKQESSTFQAVSRREKMDHDDIDMSGDEFQDDDETPGYEPDRDEDVKDSKDRVRREQLGANLFGDADEREVEKEEEAERKEREQRKKMGKVIEKTLKRVDKQVMYNSESDDEDDPFHETSSESDSDFMGDKDENKDEKDKTGASGASSKGTNTPQGKKAAAEAAKKGKSLKRPGSPIASDSSGTESGRKKKKLDPSAMGGSRSTTPLPGSFRNRAGAGSTSDGEATGGEMSDGVGGKKKRRDKLGTGARGTPTGSRAGSPAPPSGPSPTKGPGSPRAGSPAPAVTAQEIIDALPALPAGISIGNLLKMFPGRVAENTPGVMTRKDWINLVKQNTSYSATDKLLRRKA